VIRCHRQGFERGAVKLPARTGLEWDAASGYFSRRSGSNLSANSQTRPSAAAARSHAITGATSERGNGMDGLARGPRNCSATIGNVAISATAAVENNFSLQTTIGDLALAATGAVVVSGALDAEIDPITCNASGTVEVTQTRDGIGGWWERYVHAELARKRARREALARTAELAAVAPAPFA